MISRERLIDLVCYDEETGIFTWRRARKKCTPGAIVGSRRADGYILIRVDGARYYAHRLAWLIMTGEIPALEIDHIDGNPSNNSFANLRLVTARQNMQNRPMQKNNSLGLKGVRRSASGKFYAGIQVDGEYVHLGTYDDALIAAAAYEAAARKHFGEFARQEAA